MSLANYIRRTKGEDREDINRLLGVMSDIFYPEPEEGSVQERIVLGQERRIRTSSSFTGILDVQEAETRDKYVIETPTLQMPTACESYQYTHVDAGTFTYEKTDSTKYGGGAIFGGTNERITIANVVGGGLDVAVTDPFSIAFWFKRANLAAADYIFGKSTTLTSTGYNIQIDASGRIVWTLSDGTAFTVLSSIDQDDDAYHSCVCRYDGTSNETGMDIFIDGLDDTNSQVSNAIGSITNTVQNTVGTNGGESGDHFTGSLAWLMMLKEDVSNAWITAFNGGFFDWSGGNQITCIPFVGNNEVWAEATTPFCVSS